MGNLLDKIQCPDCLDTGKDNLCVYDDGRSYCQSCHKTFFNDEGSMEEQDTTDKKHSALLTSLNISSLPNRGISEGVCAFFGYGTSTYTGYLGKDYVQDEPVHVASYCDSYGDVVAQKVRGSKKRFTVRGDASKMTLYGQWKYAPSDKVFVTVCEGEIDALSVATSQGVRFPIVSVPNGAAGARKALEANLEWLSGFKHVVLGFDNDKAGRKASKECIDLFEPGKVRVATWTMKDANEMLLAGKGKQIVDCLFGAKEQRPDKICTPSDLLSRVLERPEVGISWPWKAMDDCTLGMREQQLIVVGAGAGIGKTEFAKDILLKMAGENKVPCGIFSFEQDAADTMRRLIGGLINKPLHLPGEWWDKEVIESKAKELQDYIYLYDNWGGAKMEDIAPKMRYLAKAQGVKFFVVDHLTALAAKMDGNERIGIDKTMEFLAALTRELKCSILLMCHLARDKSAGDKSDSWGSGRMPVSENFRGSGSIESWADVLLGLSRNADSDDALLKKVLVVQCLKSRLAGAKRGEVFNLMYNDKIGKLTE